MTNIFAALGNVLSRGVEEIGRGIAAEKLGVDFRKKAEMLGRLNEIEIATKRQEPELRRMQVESQAFNRKALEDAARENTSRRRIETLTSLFSGEEEPPAELYQGLDPLEIAAARQAGENARSKREFEMGGGRDEITLSQDIPALNLRAGQKINRAELQSLTSLRNDTSGHGNPQVIFGGGKAYWADPRTKSISPVELAGNEPLPPDLNRYGQTRVPEGITNSLKGLEVIGRGLDKIAADLEARGDSLGAIKGRLADLSERELGGFGLSPETVRLLIDIKAGRKMQSFAEGGKQLTGTEYNQFLEILPNEQDNLQQALIKIQNAREWLAINRNAYERFLDPSIKSRLGVGAPRPSAGIEEIQLERGPDGKLRRVVR